MASIYENAVLKTHPQIFPPNSDATPRKELLQ